MELEQEEEDKKVDAYVELYNLITLENESDPNYLEIEASQVVTEINNLISYIENDVTFKNSFAYVSIIPAAIKLREAISLIPSNLAYTGTAILRQNIDLLHVRVCFVEHIMVICKDFMKTVNEFITILQGAAVGRVSLTQKLSIRTNIKRGVINIFAMPLQLVKGQIGVESLGFTEDQITNLNNRELIFYWLSGLSDLIPVQLQSPECELSPGNIQYIINQINTI